jgi:hypothetical protein
MAPTMTGANLVPLRTPQPMMIPPQPFFMGPTPPQLMPFGNIAPPPPMPGMAPKPMMEMSGEPPLKRMRGEESLIPESEFFARHPSPVTFKVAVPNMADKPGESNVACVCCIIAGG